MGQIVCTDKGILAVEQNKVLIPPAWNRTFAWGYADLSCRLGTYESDKVHMASATLPLLSSLGVGGSLSQASLAAAPKARRALPASNGRELDRDVLWPSEQAVFGNV